MTGRWRLGPAAIAAGLLMTLTGCPAGEIPDPEPTAAPSADQALPGRPTNASTDLPAYAGPPADAPPSIGPLTRLRATVDLTPATPGVFARAVGAVAAPDGGAYVVLSPANRDLPQSLVTVAGDYTLAGSVPLPAWPTCGACTRCPTARSRSPAGCPTATASWWSTRRPAGCGRRCSRRPAGAPTRSPAGRRSSARPSTCS